MGPQQEDGLGSSEKASQRGLLRLMLRLPALRGRLQILSRRLPQLPDLFEAYEAAAVALERLHKDESDETLSLRREYETICRELEDEVASHCLHDAPSGSIPDKLGVVTPL